MLCFRKFPVAKKFMDKRGGGVSRFYVEKFLSHSAENFRRGTLQCFINFYAYEGHITIFNKKFVVSQYQKTS